LFVSGNSLPSSSSCNRTPNSSKNAAARGAGNARNTLRTTRDEPPQKSRSVTTRLVTLQREPPLTRILAPMRRAPSTHRTRRCGEDRAAKIAVASPAAPAPTTTRSAWEDTRVRRGYQCRLGVRWRTSPSRQRTATSVIQRERRAPRHKLLEFASLSWHIA